VSHRREPWYITILDRIRSSRRIKVFLLVFLPFIYLIIFFFAPFIIALMYSLGMFKQVVYEFVFQPQISLEYYYRLFQYPGVLVAIQRSFYYAILTTVGTFLLSYPVAYYLGVKLPDKYQEMVVLVLFTPFWVNFLLRIYGMRFIFHELGFLNMILTTLGIVNDPIKILGTDTAVILVMIYTYVILMILPIYGVLEKLDKELLEAAATLGASPVKTFLKVTLPLSVPGILAGSLLVFIPAVGEFVIPELVGGANTVTLGTVIYNFFLRVKGTMGWGLGSAAGLIYIGLILVLSYLYIRLVGGEIRLG